MRAARVAGVAARVGAACRSQRRAPPRAGAAAALACLLLLLSAAAAAAAGDPASDPLPRRALLQASPGRVAQRLLDALNALARATPALGSTAAATTDARGSGTAQYRNATSAVQQTPPRTAAVFQAGATAVDEAAQRTAASGSSASVAKRIPTEAGSA